MRKETLEELMDLVSDELHKERCEDFNGRSIAQYKAFEESKAKRVLELEGVLEELNGEYKVYE